MTTVYATAQGRAFHATNDCNALYNGQSLSDWDYDYEFPPPAGARLPTTHAVQPATPEQATASGKHPCGYCKPTLALADDFGHKPVELDGDDFCARCRDRGIDEDGDPWSYPTLWPCTSALVLGLVARPSKDCTCLFGPELDGNEWLHGSYCMTAVTA